jgi:hypothetical protein
MPRIALQAESAAKSAGKTLTGVPGGGRPKNRHAPSMALSRRCETHNERHRNVRPASGG